jgi:shikimate kinase
LENIGKDWNKNTMKNIILIGMRGSGKSTIARQIANILQRQCIDLDTYLSKDLGMSIAEIVSQKGWEYFREQEMRITQKITALDTLVIAAGGGIVLRNENIKSLKQNGIIIYLLTTTNTLIKRLQKDTPRPKLTNSISLQQEIETVWEERKSFYQNAADITILTENKTQNILAEEIIRKLKRRL